MKTRFRDSTVWLSLVLFLNACASPAMRGYDTRLENYRGLATDAASATPASCGNILRAMFQRGNAIRPVGATVQVENGVLRYPAHVNPQQNPDWYLTFGFETEYTKDELAGILTVYGPKPETGISKEQWLNVMTSEERVAWARNLLRNKPVLTEDSGLIKLVDDPAFAFLPEGIAHDSTGNVELILAPVKTYEEWERNAQLLNERFGLGSMQGMIGTPRQPFFGNLPTMNQAEAIAENQGYFAFMHDFDVLDKLEAGAERYVADPSKAVARTFQHQWLGPITEKRQYRMNLFLDEHAKGNKWDPKYIDKIRGRDGSFKYVGSTAYRPDVGGPDRIANEVRDAHKNFDLLKDRMLRTIFYHQNGRQQFRSFQPVLAFSPVTDFEKFSPEVRAMLQAVSPSRAIPNFTYLDEDKLALEVYRNFAYPMRDWSANVAALGSPEGLAAKVAAAQANYSAKLTEITAEHAAGRLTTEQASLKVQGALAVFSKESELAQAYKQWQVKNLTSDSRWNHYIELTIKELAPLKQAFPASVWEGPLEQRLARFQQKWGERVRIVEDVNFELKEAQFDSIKKRKVLAISLAGLNADQQRQLMRDYSDAFARGTVSFPLYQGAGHLYTRVGDQTFSFLTGVSMSPYQVGGMGNYLEPMIALNPLEELNLRTYLDNAKSNPGNVVGPFNYNGISDGQVTGLLTDNRRLSTSSGSGHSCTSWVCTAGIGEQREALYRLVGARAEYNVHTNPGWWSSFLTGVAKRDRIPFVVYWSTTPISEMEAKAVAAKTGKFEWNFARH